MNESTTPKTNLDEIGGLVEQFGSQSAQLRSAEEQLRGAEEQLRSAKISIQKTKGQMCTLLTHLQTAAETLENKIDETVQRIIASTKVGMEEELILAKQWYKKAEGELSDICYTLTDSLEPFNSAFDAENFKALCAKIAELAKILEEYKTAKSDLTDILSEMRALRAQQAADRAFMEEKLAQILEWITPPISGGSNT